MSTGYLLALAMVIPVTGWAAERFGARNSWVAALLLFIGGSILCGIAWSSGSLIGFRVLQGVGGGSCCRSPRRSWRRPRAPNDSGA